MNANTYDVMCHFLTGDEKFLVAALLIAITLITFVRLVTAWAHNDTVATQAKTLNNLIDFRLKEIEQLLINANEMAPDAYRDIGTISEDARKIKKTVKEIACQRKGLMA